MIEYTSKRIVCPHCGHHTRVELDASQGWLPATLRGCRRRADVL